MDAERAHELGISALRTGLASPFYPADPSFGFEPIELFGLQFKNPFGIAAGFDKNGVVVEQLASLGFAFVEVGTVTARPQPGNPKPRMFRLPERRALINRLGFNNEGAVAVAKRLSRMTRKCVVGVNIGRNKDVSNENAIENYVEAFRLLQPVADYVVVNISSPNTPNLRELQEAESLESLLGALQTVNTELGRRPLLVKIAPDLSDERISTIVEKCIALEVDGIIATNTTVARERITSPDVDDIGPGGVSGAPLARMADRVITKIYSTSDGKIPIIGVGGVFAAEDAFEKIAAGASLVQAYTGFVYGGPTFPADVCRGLGSILSERGFRSISEAVGSAVR